MIKYKQIKHSFKRLMSENDAKSLVRHLAVTSFHYFAFLGHTDIQAANFSSFVNGSGYIDWDRIMVEVDASQLVHLGDHLTFTPDEISSYGHPIDELLVDVRI